MASENPTMKIPTPPPSESTSASSSPSPGIDDRNEFFLSQLTATDPLSYLLQGDSSGTDEASSQGQSPADWSPFTSWLEATQQEKVPDMGLGSDFNFTMPMDLDFEGSMAIDPSALHFNTSIFTQPEAPVFDASGAFKPEFFTQLLNQNLGRRMSVTSSSSSSGASLSPVLDHRPPPAQSSAGDLSNEDAATELAQRVLQAAGITFAVPVETKSEANDLQPKLAIPRLPRPTHAVSIPSQSPSGSPPTPNPVAPPTTASISSTTVLGRPKTSHTTIERRYRTNLNARITGLKQSVPALRVLEARLSGKESPTDVVDERGFVDGVKIGRKMSKANVLGKATEYIKVLKRRENRLKREQAGLKSLVGGLVNGSALLHAWETQWRESFGGEEKDEIEDEMGSDDEDGEAEGDDDDDDSGRAKKKPRTVKTVKEKPVKMPTVLPPVSQANGLTPSALPEKRKRGRPRKVPIPAPAPIMPVQIPMETNVPMSVYSGQPSAQQYMLAAFAFVSFFNSSLKSPSPPYAQPHSHTGAVLSNPMTSHLSATYGWRDLIQAFHLVVSTLVFFSIVLPWVPTKYKRTPFASSILVTLQTILPASLRPLSPTREDAPVLISQRVVGSDRVALLEALSPSSQGTEIEGCALRKALGISSGIVGLCQGVVKASKKDRGIELNQLEQRAWVRLGEIVALNDDVSLATRLQTYWGMSWHISTFSASTTDLTTLALIMRPISGSRSCDLWERAGKREILRPYEKLVLESMDVNEAARRLEKWRSSRSRNQSFERPSPLGILAELLIWERIKIHASVLFVKSVDKSLHQQDSDSESDDSDDEGYILGDEMQAEDEIKRAQTIQAGRSLGGETAELALSLEKVWEMGTCELDDVLSSSPTPDDGDIKALLSAVVLYRKIFRTSLVYPSGVANGEAPCSVILTPPPSPTPKDGDFRLSLRKVLGSSAFETLGDEGHLGLALEHARDSVVDMLVDSRSNRMVF